LRETDIARGGLEAVLALMFAFIAVGDSTHRPPLYLRLAC